MGQGIKQTEKAIQICREALEKRPYDEELCQELMGHLIQTGDHTEAASVYETLRDRLQTEFGITPGQQVRELYQTARAAMEPKRFSPEEIETQLLGEDPVDGVCICDYDAFKLYYRAEQRMAPRRGDAVHIVILTLAEKDGEELPEERAAQEMERLQTALRTCLRSEDVAAPCGPYQFVAMLVQANYEDSERVSQRVVDAFSRSFPGSAAKLQTVVMPLRAME